MLNSATCWTMPLRVYPFAESQWAASRGMAFKFSSGLQSRYRLLNSSTTLMFATLGLFYEYEEWERPMPAPNGPKYAYSHRIKSHLSLSMRNKIGEHWELTTTAIHQATPDTYFKKAASEVPLTSSTTSRPPSGYEAPTA